MMRRLTVASMAWAVAGGLLLLGEPLFAQATRGPAPDSEAGVRIRRLEGIGPRSLARTPEYNPRTNIVSAGKPAQEWVQIVVTYDTEPEWIDEMEIRFYVMSEGEIEGRKAFSLYRETVRCMDVERGARHLSAVYLRPVAVKRYGPVVAVAVEIVRDGKVAAEETERSLKDLPDGRWWTDPRVVESKSVLVREGSCWEA